MALIFALLCFPPYHSADTMKIWFTGDSLGLRLCDFLNTATVSIDYCCYNSSRPDVTATLIDAHNRGVKVRVITDNTRLDDHWVNELRNAGITVWSDSGTPYSSAYMHNKFAIKDLGDTDSTNDALWVASYNPNLNELAADYALEIPDSRLTRAYLSEFNQLWGSTGSIPNPDSARFHIGKSDNLLTHRFFINGYPAYLYFSPQTPVVDTITAFTARAENTILFAINSFTYNPLGDTMIHLWQEGIVIAGTIDKAGANHPASEYPRLRTRHIPILIDSVPFGNGILHEKIIVIDSAITIVGSANWSQNANFYNDENIIIFTDPQIARRFLREILDRYLEAGGTYPPGITEITPPAKFKSPTRFSSPFIPPQGTVLWNITGTKIAPGTTLPSGCYFLVEKKRTWRIVIIR